MSEDPTRLSSRLRTRWTAWIDSVGRQWRRLPKNLRARWPWMLLGAIFMAHIAVNTSTWSRISTPTQTFHDDDVRLVQYAMVLSGRATGYSLPLVELQPASWEGQGAGDLLLASLRNPEDRLNSYKNTAPIWFITSSLLPTIAGISPLTVRLGPLLVLALLAVALYGAGRKIVEGPEGPLFAAAFVTLVPVGWQGAQVGVPTLGNMCAVGLGLWALLRSDAFRRPIWAAVAGLILGTSGRWGESVGDALAVWAALVGPIAICAGVAIFRLARERRWKDAPGPILAGAIAGWIVPWTWMIRHTKNYVLQEATGAQNGENPQSRGGIAGSESAVPHTRELGDHETPPTAELDHIELGRILENADAYPEALWWSLVSPAGMVLVGLGCVGLFWIRPRWKIVLLLSSFLGSWLVLSLSEKGNDYYAAPMVPSLALVVGLGITALPRGRRWIGGVGLAWMTAGWLLHSHKDLPSIGRLACTTPITALVAGDAQMCTPDWETPTLYPWFREWRRPANQNRLSRQRFGSWLVRGQGHQALLVPPEGSLILLVDPHRRAGDVAELLVQSIRPDLIVHKTAEPPPRDGDLAHRLLANHARIYALTFSENPGRPDARARSLPGWLTGINRLADSPDADIWEVSWQP